MRIVYAAIAVSGALTPQVVFANEGNITVDSVESIEWQLSGVSAELTQENFRLEDLAAKEKEFAAPARTLNIEGYASVWNKFTDADLFAQVRGVTTDIYVSVEVIPGLQLAAWNIQDIDPEPKVGDELFLSAAYEVPVTEKLLLRGEVGRSWTDGFNDMWILIGTVQYQDFDFTITEFVVDNGPRLDPDEGEDATRLQFGYTLPEIPGFQSRLVLTHEEGFGLPTITTFGVEAELPLTNRWSLRGEVFTPLIKQANDPRETAVMFGLAFNF